MKKSVIAITIISSLFIFQECKRDNGDVTTTPTDTTHHVIVPPIDSSKYVPNTGDSTCFNSQIYPLIMSNCAMSNCHDSKTKQLDMTYLLMQTLLDLLIQLTHQL